MPAKRTKPQTLQLLSHLSGKQVKAFEHFLNSPYFLQGNQTPLTSLLQSLMPFTRKESWQDWEEAAWSKWFPEKAFNQNYFRKSCVKLGKFYFQFLTQEAFMKDKNEQSLFLLHALNNMQAMDLFPSKYEDAQKTVEKQPRDYESFRIASQVAAHAISHQHLHPQRKHNTMLDEAIFNFNQSYFIQRLKFAIEQISQSQIISADLQPDLQEIEALLELIAIHLESHHELVKAYFYLAKANLYLQNLSYYDELVKLLERGLKDVAAIELLDLFGGTINYAIRQQRMGHTQFQTEYEKLYEWMLERKMLASVAGTVSWHVNNILLYYVNTDQQDKIEALIAWSERQLPKQQAEKMMLYIQGILHYVRGELELAQKAFVKFLKKKGDIFYTMNARMLLARVYYEQEAYRILESHISASMQFIRTQQLPQSQKKRRYDFFRLLRKLHQIAPSHQKKMDQLTQEIEAFGRSNNQRWLLQKLNEKRIPFG